MREVRRLSLALFVGLAIGGGDEMRGGDWSVPHDLRPRWTAPRPDQSKPLGGYARIQPDFKSLVFYGDKVMGRLSSSLLSHTVTLAHSLSFTPSLPTLSTLRGSYNHNVMFDFLVSEGFLIAWKNCMKDEDCNGQRILFSMSPDARNWSAGGVLFPPMNTTELGATMEPSPTVHINGRRYAASNPGIHNSSRDSSAQGSFWQLWPSGLDPRNAGPPTSIAVQYNHTLLMRRVKADASLGPLFWASHTAPKVFEAATRMLKIVTLDKMDAETQADVGTLGPHNVETPCHTTDGTLKCEACPGGCQLYDTIDHKYSLANERTHWIVPSKGIDIIAYRATNRLLYASVRVNSTSQHDWSKVFLTDIPNDNSNINAGPLPDGRIYLLNDPVTGPNNTTHYRNPITVTTSSDGISFDKVGVAVTCTDLAPSTCTARHEGGAKNPGPSYPQGVTVTDPAPKELHGFYAGNSCNKEDIWSFFDCPPLGWTSPFCRVTKLDYSSF